MKTREQISFNMSRVRASGSQIEVRLGKAMWAAGIRYRKQYKKLPGTPDFVIISAKIAVFCDSSFWHGRDWPQAAAALKTNRDFWISKIERNIARDKKVGEMLGRLGWPVLRFWDDEIKRDSSECAATVMSVVQNKAIH